MTYLCVAQRANCAKSWTAWGEATWVCRRWALAVVASGAAAAACCANPRASHFSASRHLTISFQTTWAPSPKRTTIFSNGRNTVALSHRPCRDESTRSALLSRPHCELRALYTLPTCISLTFQVVVRTFQSDNIFIRDHVFDFDCA